MSVVKDIKLKVINSKDANAFMKRHHYSGKVVSNSQLHFGAFLNGIMHGVMSFGPSTDKKKMLGLVKNTGWNEFIELNRMAFDEHLPRNSESRCISVAMRLMKKNAPHIKFVLSFADGTQCGDGTIYRASGFKLIGVKRNNTLRIDPNTGEKIHSIQAHHRSIQKEWQKWDPSPGFQLKYIYFLNKESEKDLTIPILPFSTILDKGAGMYKGEKRQSQAVKA